MGVEQRVREELPLLCLSNRRHNVGEVSFPPLENHESCRGGDRRSDILRYLGDRPLKLVEQRIPLGDVA